MICPKCNHEIIEGAKYCGKCGYALETEEKTYTPDEIDDEATEIAHVIPDFAKQAVEAPKAVVNAHKAVVNAPVTVKTKKPFCFASVLFFLYPLIYIINDIINNTVMKYQFNGTLKGISIFEIIKSSILEYFQFEFYSITSVLLFIAFVVLAILLFAKHSGFLLPVALIPVLLINSVVCIYELINLFKESGFIFRNLPEYWLYAVWLIAIALFLLTDLLCTLLLVVMSFVTALKKPRKGFMKLSFLPGILYFVSTAIYTVVRIVMIFKNSMYGIPLWVPQWLVALAYLLLGIWLYKVSGTYGSAQNKTEK
ncbi:MAG: zinc ribbon domain-containing protein [Clostridia bacterium]|nr:zinc ribbon domain-containing protein [Clostridia bacterium]